MLPGPPPYSYSYSSSGYDDTTDSPQVLESRALYNLGNVYHARGKHASLHASGYSQQEVDDFVRSSLEQAARHYE